MVGTNVQHYIILYRNDFKSVIKDIKVSSTTNHIKIMSRFQSSRNPNKLISPLNNKTKQRFSTKYLK